MRRRSWPVLVLTLLVLAGSGHPQSKDDARYWVFFVDKGTKALTKATMLQAARAEISERALARRAKTVPGDKPLVDETDLPVHQPYVESLRLLGHEPVVESRWLNAVSVPLGTDEIAAVESLPFVREVRPVRRSQGRPEPATPIDVALPHLLEKAAEIDYGISLSQNELMHVPEVHSLGITGRGVYVGMLDTGFRYQDHEAFRSLKVLGERDFINNDNLTRNEPGDAAGQDSHGTETLSTIAGYRDGILVGPAFGAQFYLAKTEYVPSEIPVEEDYWVAGIEWLESVGVDVVSSSLGYLDWYTYADMDGKTAVTTIAAELAVAKGVVVVNSAGNEGTNSWRHIIAPSDGAHVIAVGAVSASRVRVPFSSVGPTADGRIKPDVMAMGSGVISVQPGSISRYSSVAGTSFSCPLTAGVAALLLSAHPDLTPPQVYEALTRTADHADLPDTLSGYGVIDAKRALLYSGPVFSNVPQVAVVDQQRLRISIKAASKDGIGADAIRMVYHTDVDSTDRTVVLTPSGEVNEYVGDALLAGGTWAFVRFALTDQAGAAASSPYGAPEQSFQVSSGGTVSSPPLRPGRKIVPTTFKLYPNYPNPFNSTTTIEFDLPEAATVSLTIYNILGQRVRELLNDRPLVAERHSYVWDSRNDRGELVSGGIYYFVIEAGQVRESRRMVFLP